MYQAENSTEIPCDRIYINVEPMMAYHCHGEFVIDGECDGKPRYRKLYAHHLELVYNRAVNVYECRLITNTTEQCKGILLLQKITRGSSVLGFWRSRNEAICGPAPEVSNILKLVFVVF